MWSHLACKLVTDGRETELFVLAIIEYHNLKLDQVQNLASNSKTSLFFMKFLINMIEYSANEYENELT